MPPACVTIALVVACVLIWVAGAALPDGARIAYSAGFVPARASGVAVADALPVWITPLTATLLHGGLLHLGMNMLMLGFCGRFVEPALGGRGMIVLYAVSAFTAAAGQWAWAPLDATPMIGASGAISGVLAAYALLFGERRVRARSATRARVLQAAWLAAAWIGINLLVELASMGSGYAVATPAHIGGFLGGLVLTRRLLAWRLRGLRRRAPGA